MSRYNRGARSNAENARRPEGAAGEASGAAASRPAADKGKATFEKHLAAQQENREAYAARVGLMIKYNVDMSQNGRVRSLAVAWARKDHALADALMSNRDHFGLVEVIKALTLLDSARKIRSQEKKIQMMTVYGNTEPSPKKLGMIRSTIDNLTAIKPKIGSASGAVAKHVRRWVRGFTKEELEFFALHFPKDPWKKLADICHLNPNKDFVNLPWFLRFCFGDPPPADSVVYQCNMSLPKGIALTTSGQLSVNRLVEWYHVPYAHIKQYKDYLTPETKAIIALRESLDTLLWYYEDLQCLEVDSVIQERLEKGESVGLSNGKLLERLLTIKMMKEGIPLKKPFISLLSKRASSSVETPLLTKDMAPFFELLLPIVDDKLKSISLPLEAPIAVFGDRSASMDVAVRTSTIIASLLSTVVKAKLIFFNRTSMTVTPPTSIQEMLEKAVSIGANGGTAPACALYPFYTGKKVLKTIIIVTDEEENYAHASYTFATLYKKYYFEVYPAKLVFISFLKGQHETGKMVNDLRLLGFKPIQYKFDGTRPDLSKLDGVFGELCMKTNGSKKLINEMAAQAQEQGLTEFFKCLMSSKDIYKGTQ